MTSLSEVAVQIAPADVHESLRRHLLTDGLDLVLDPVASQGSWIVDARTGERYLDLMTFFASAPLGLNPAGLADDPDFLALLGQVAANKPANPDIYTTHLADFVETFARVLGDPALPHLFFVEGGALAVENALKTAFDWKSRRNEAAGRSPDSGNPNFGSSVLHLRRAFPGRSGYTLSLTNTDPTKTARFPKFDWPRIDAADPHVLDHARAAFEAAPHDIACFIAEPIQGEGGDNHLSAEFLQAMQEMCHTYDALFVLDEVQTGVGLTGTAWAYQQLGLEPDIVAFGKKVQLGGIMAGRRVDEVPDNVFTVPSRINSTWGGGLVDMVRSRRLLEIIERVGLFERVATIGGWFLDQLQELAKAHSDLVTNVRGRGLMCAFDLPDAQIRDAMVERMRVDEHTLMLGCGERSIRMRPALTISTDELSLALASFDRVLARLAQAGLAQESRS